MLVRFTRLTNERHRFEIVRDDGTSESHELETRSTLLHDLAHYAVELEAGLEASFYGRLANGQRLEELTAEPPTTPEAMQTELVVVQMQNTFRHGDDSKEISPEAQAMRIHGGFVAMQSEPPEWLTGELVGRIRERLRRVLGQWRATAFHGTMELPFPAAER